MQAVLECDVERNALIREEAELVAQVKRATDSTGAASAAESSSSAANGAAPSQQGNAAEGTPSASPADAASARLQEVYSRLQEIDADGAPARAAMILAGLSFDTAMQARATTTFSGGATCAVLVTCACCTYAFDCVCYY
jgi:ATPase subunit of ABC transporter with duplicated ATPase domains